MNIDASASSANIIYEVANLALNVTGSSGTDTVRYLVGGTLTGTLIGVEKIEISAGTLTVDASQISSFTSVSGGGSLVVNVDNTSVDLSNVSVTGTITINDDANSNNITGTSSDDILNLAGGNDVINLGAGNDTINTTIADLDVNDAITDTSGTDTINITTNGTSDLSNISGIENINLADGGNNITLGDDTTMSVNGGTGADIFNITSTDLDNSDVTIDAGGGIDTLNIIGSGTIADIDFTNLSNFESLDLASGTNNVELLSEAGGAFNTGATINGNTGTDNFTLDFTNLNNFAIDGGSGSDTLTVNGTNTTISTDTSLSTIFNGVSTNIETIDFTNFTFSTSGGAEYEVTGSLIKQLTDASNKLTLNIDADDASKLEFTDVGADLIGGTIDDVLHGADGTAITSGTYFIDDGVNPNVELVISGI